MSPKIAESARKRERPLPNADVCVRRTAREPAMPTAPAPDGLDGLAACSSGTDPSDASGDAASAFSGAGARWAPPPAPCDATRRWCVDRRRAAAANSRGDGGDGCRCERRLFERYLASGKARG